MIHHENIAETIFDIIHYADDEDIKILLQNSSIQCNYKHKVSYKTILLEHIFEDIYYLAIGEKLKVTSILDANNYDEQKTEFHIIDPKFITKSKPNNTLLYLHLYALSECYLSYLFIQSTDKQIFKEIFKICKKNEAYNTFCSSILTDKDKTKILKMIINCYTKNKFYYYFYNDILTKLEIVSSKKQPATYKYTYFKLVDKEKSTHVINKALNIDYNLGKNILRLTKENELNILEILKKPNDDNFECFIESCFKELEFQSIKEYHSRLVKAILLTKSTFCKCCNPNIKMPNSTKICNDCKDLFSEFQELQKSKELQILKTCVEQTDLKNYFSVVQDIDLKKELYEISPFEYTNMEVRKNRKKKVTSIIKNLETELEKYMNNRAYKELKNKINDIKNQINKCF